MQIWDGVLLRACEYIPCLLDNYRYPLLILGITGDFIPIYKRCGGLTDWVGITSQAFRSDGRLSNEGEAHCISFRSTPEIERTQQNCGPLRSPCCVAYQSTGGAPVVRMARLGRGFEPASVPDHWPGPSPPDHEPWASSRRCRRGPTRACALLSAHHVAPASR
jgi:hypothetical protein